MKQNSNDPLASSPKKNLLQNDNGCAQYACVSSQSGTIYLMKIQNLRAELLQLSGLDTESEVLGIYYD